jgi:hypothetical protein
MGNPEIPRREFRGGRLPFLTRGCGVACQLTVAAKRLKQGSGNFARSSSRPELYRVPGGTKAAGGDAIWAEVSANRPNVYAGLVAVGPDRPRPVNLTATSSRKLESMREEAPTITLRIHGNGCPRI